MIKGVIFDMDGTIVDSLPYHHKAWEIFFKHNKVENFSKKLKDYKGGGTLDLMKAVYGDKYSIKELKIMSHDKEIIFRDIYRGNIQPINGFIEFIESLKSKNILIGLASNAIRENVILTLEELNVYNYFNSIICGDEVKKGKPDPEMFNKTLESFDIDNKHCLIFEDSIEGIQGACNSGINSVGITSSSTHRILIDAGANGTIENYLNISDKLKKINLFIL
tara:strand:+ start:1005 stop:1667 length:663 start_codon:yes stop_codon:yes gene_type:complete